MEGGSRRECCHKRGWQKVSALAEGECSCRRGTLLPKGSALAEGDCSGRRGVFLWKGSVLVEGGGRRGVLSQTGVAEGGCS